ncbi:MAG TPA: PilZ domain-containing protein [Myxococcaceae bacterium]|nr:PilZ domain-containing protein [Myxococcaceae bacterium]
MSTDFNVWLESFRQLHERARRRLLTSDERVHYLESREQLARSLLAAQGQRVPESALARRNFRVPKGLTVDVSFRSGSVRSRTLDLSSGGFSCLLPGNLAENERIGFALWLPEEESDEGPVVGRARIASLSHEEERPRRVSFAFTDVSEPDAERLELLILDLALKYIVT